MKCRTPTVYLAWRSPRARWYPVAELSWSSDAGYCFRYLKGSERAEREAGFRPLIEFPRFERPYQSAELFATFENRVPSPAHPDYRAYVEWLALPRDAGAMDLLGRGGGMRATDMFEVFPKAEPRDGKFEILVFVHGLRHRDAAARERALALCQGDGLVLVAEPGNAFDDLAVRTETTDDVHLGYVPRYLAPDLARLGIESVRATVERVNPPPAAPMQFRVLVRLTAPWPEGFAPCTGPDFRPRTEPALRSPPGASSDTETARVGDDHSFAPMS